MVRLDADLLARVPSQLNCLNDRQLSLRGYKISAIENLGVTRDTLDSLDLTDNSITSLSNLPLLLRLAHLLLSSNPIRTISPSLASSLPNLESLTLANSALTRDQLGAVGDTLGRCKKLKWLVLKGCAMAEGAGEGQAEYRSWLIYKVKSLRALDYERVKEKERAHSHTLFELPTGGPTSLATSIISSVPSTAFAAAAATTFEPGQAVEVSAMGKKGRLLSKEDKEKVRKQIEGAETVEEIRRLQRMLSQGFV